MKRYTPEQLKYELGACWATKDIADLMTASGLRDANALDVLDASSSEHEDIIWMALRMVPAVCRPFTRRCATDAQRLVDPTLAWALSDYEKLRRGPDLNYILNSIVWFSRLSGQTTGWSSRSCSHTLKKYRRWLREEIVKVSK